MNKLYTGLFIHIYTIYTTLFLRDCKRADIRIPKNNQPGFNGMSRAGFDHCSYDDRIVTD